VIPREGVESVKREQVMEGEVFPHVIPREGVESPIHHAGLLPFPLVIPREGVESS
jgi:hypothetical protein